MIFLFPQVLWFLKELRILPSKILGLWWVVFAKYFFSAAVPSLRWVVKCQWHSLNNNRNEGKKDPVIIVLNLKIKTRCHF